MRIDTLSIEIRKSMVEKKVTRLVKSDAGAVMQEIDDIEQTIKLAGQRGEFDLIQEFGVPEERVEALDISTQLAIAAGIEALRDAGIPLVMNYKKTSRGTFLPDRWKLPESMQDETGIIFCSAFPGLDRMAEESEKFTQHQVLSAQLDQLQTLMFQLRYAGESSLISELEQRESELEELIVNLNYHFDRRFVFRVLSMGHSQFAEYIGAKGPVTHVNAACATTTHAVSVAEDWIRAGRCRRVVIIAGDDVTNPNLVQWIGTSMFASGAATIEGDVRKAALPFDKRRNGLIMGMGAASLVIESEDACRERGVRGICEVVSTVIANSAFHGTRLDVKHVGQVMDRLVSVAEARFGLNRSAIAASTAFISHETYTPARGGSASAEIHALRDTFKEDANQVIIANTKGFTGHTMGVGIEDVVAVKILETGIVPPIAHISDGFEPDPELGDLNLSKGGKYDPQFSLRLGAGFGSQIAMTLYRKIPGEGLRINNNQHSEWMAAAAGYQEAELEVVQRTMRIKNQGEPSLEPIKSYWEYGQGPTLWAAVPGDSVMAAQNVTVIEEKTPTATKPAVVIEQVSTVPHVELVTKQIGNTDNAQIQAHVLEVVSEKTGYPVEMLDLELDLEADLGIDTVKQAELFAAIRIHYGIPRREDLRLSEYNTLSKVIGFVSENLSLLSGTATTPQPVETLVEEVLAEKLDSLQTIELDTFVGESPVAESISTENSSPEIQAHVLAVVSEKTGYPVEMLDLELDLEADLGIDTVKQAELFAAIRTHYSIPRREDLRLSEYNTLSKVIGFVVENLKPVELSVVVPAKVLSAEGQEQVHEELGGMVSDSPAIRRRVPKPVLRPRLDLCIPTAVEIDEVSRIVIVKDSSKTADALAKKLKTRGAQVLVVDGAEAVQKSRAWSESGLVQGVYYLPGLDADPEWQKSDLPSWKSAIHQRVEVLFDLMKVLPEKAFLLTGTRMGGLLGLLNPINPMGGAISGFTKALARERSDVLIKTVDFEAGVSATLVASRLLEETLHDASVAEIGWEADLRYSAALVDEPAKNVDHKPLEQGTVFLVSGGTAGVVAPVLMDLVRSTKGKFYLLGRTKLPERSDILLGKLESDREGLKKEFSQLLSAAGQKATPVAVEQKVAALERAKSTLDLMDSIKTAGGEAEYLECDVLDEGSVQGVLDRILQRTKKMDVFIHAAGVEKSRKLESKTTEELHQVMDVKADGFFNLFKAMEKTNLLPSSVVFFTSVAGRFGNSGQVDYSSANDMLSKYAAWLPTQYEGMQAISIDWGAWGEVGMASRGSIPMMMQRAGIEMMNPTDASAYVKDELTAGTCGEIVVSGSLGALESGKSGNIGLDVARADAALRAGNPEHIMLSHLTSFEVQAGLSLETVLDPNEHPFLRDHALNGIPVLPGVIGIEGFSVAARHIASKLAGEKSSFVVDHLEDIQFLTPFKFYKNLPRHIQWKAQAVRQAEGLVVYATLESELVRHNGQREHMLHFTGKIFLTQKPLSPEVSLQLPVWGDDVTVCAEDIYKLYFHGPSFQVLDCVQKSGNFVMGRLAKNLPSGTNNGSSISTPLLVELCFQTAGLWEAGATGTMALPHSIGTLTIYPRKVNGEPIFAEVTPFMEDGKVSFDARVVDAKGHLYLELSNYQTAPLPYAADPGLIEPMKALLLN